MFPSVTHKIRCISGLAAIAIVGFTSSTAQAAGTWERFDTDGNGQLDTWTIDDTGDGMFDRAFADFNLDGTYEIQMFNNDYDAAIDWVFVDGDGPGQYWFHDWNNDGRLDHFMLDRDGNNRYEGELYDGNGDNVHEWQKVDLYGFDGIADTWSMTGTANGAATMNQINVNHTSMMTVLGMLARA